MAILIRSCGDLWVPNPTFTGVMGWFASVRPFIGGMTRFFTGAVRFTTRQAQPTIAVARHVLVDLGHVFHLEAKEQRYRDNVLVRLHDDEFGELCQLLDESGVKLCSISHTRSRLSAIRRLCEPHAQAMAEHLHLELPRWVSPPPDPNKERDGWKTVAELRSTSAVADRLKTHVSPQSTASHFSDEESHPF